MDSDQRTSRSSLIKDLPRLDLIISTSIASILPELSTLAQTLTVIHWPIAFKAGDALYPPDAENPGWVELDRGVTLAETWKAMNALPKVRLRLHQTTLPLISFSRAKSRPLVSQISRFLCWRS
jgi:hypothetical protein